MTAILSLWQLFDRKFVDAVLSEWQRTIMDLPAGFRQAYEMVQYFSGYACLGCKAYGRLLTKIMLLGLG
jgi:hypothetical protein